LKRYVEEFSTTNIQIARIEYKSEDNPMKQPKTGHNRRKK